MHEAADVMSMLLLRPPLNRLIDWSCDACLGGTDTTWLTEPTSDKGISQLTSIARHIRADHINMTHAADGRVRKAWEKFVAVADEMLSQ